jgi:hypothetical protein
VTGASSVAQKEFLVGLSSERLAHVAQALERNWTVQLILAGVGFALVFEIGDLPRFLSKYVSQDEYNLRPVATMLPAILLYYFMKFGHLLTTFIEARQLNDLLLLEYLGDSKQAPKSLLETTSFFEVYYSTASFTGPLIAAYYVTCALVVSTGQAAALFLILKAYGANVWSMSAVALAAIALGLLYREFWRSKRGHPGTTAMAVTCPLAALLLFVVFCVFASESVWRGTPSIR